MAYNVYFACDQCGEVGAEWVNHGVSQSICIRIAREAGWKVGKKGWICPFCQESNKRKERKDAEN